MTKITFYGKDFSELREARYSLDGSKTKLPVDMEHLDLLKAFCDSFAGDDAEEDDEDEGLKENKRFKLRFPKNRELFHKYVGVFRNKEFPFGDEVYDVTLEIRCRFDEGESAYFLAAMLLCLDPDDLKFIKDSEVNITLQQVMDIFLLFMYKKQLADAAKKGIFRKYQRFENSDSRPHGTIDIARHIRENMGLKSGKIAYHYRELTANNPVNRLILAAYKRLCEKFPTLCEKHINSEESVYSTLKTLQTELGYSKTNVRDIVKENLRPVTHPYFSEYEALRKTCLKILRDENVSIFDADCSEETDAIYLNITKLWEDYIKFQFEKLEPSHKFELAPQESKRFLTGLFKGKTARPDFVIKRGSESIAILDAKFKEHWENYNDNYGFLIEDIFKCIRDKDLFKTPRTGVIFPTRNGEIFESGNDPVFDLVGVQVPEAGKNQPLQEWNRELDESVRGILVKYLEKILGKPDAP